jgi:phospholipase C
MKLDRRDFLRGAALTSGAALLKPTVGLTSAAQLPEVEADAALLRSPEESGIEHVVVVMMENRSFDHFLGWLPGADGKQSGLTYLDSAGTQHSTYPLAPDFTGCPHPNPENSYAGARVAYDNGKMDGILRAGSNDVYAIGYYVEDDLPFYNSLARNYTTLDRYFCSFLGPTFPNRLFLHSANTDRLADSLDLTSLPTIWDRLAEKGISRRYYFSNVPFLALWGLKYLGISSTYDRFLSDAAHGTLPAVSFVDPRFTIVDLDLGTDDHPHSNVKRGDSFLAQTFHAVANGPAWPSTVFIVVFDEWGGFFEHVAPPRAAAPAGDPDTDLVGGKALLGFRVPAVIASPFSLGDPARPRVQQSVFDHTSILKLIEWRWGLEALTARDRSSDIGNLALALNFSAPVAAVPSFPSPPSPSSHPCWQALGLARTAGAQAQPTTPWGALASSPRVEAWPVKKD